MARDQKTDPSGFLIDLLQYHGINQKVAEDLVAAVTAEGYDAGWEAGNNEPAVGEDI